MGNGQAVPQQMVGLFQTAFQYRRVCLPFIFLDLGRCMRFHRIFCPPADPSGVIPDSAHSRNCFDRNPWHCSAFRYDRNHFCNREVQSISGTAEAYHRRITRNFQSDRIELYQNVMHVLDMQESSRQKLDDVKLEVSEGNPDADCRIKNKSPESGRKGSKTGTPSLKGIPETGIQKLQSTAGIVPAKTGTAPWQTLIYPDKNHAAHASPNTMAAVIPIHKKRAEGECCLLPVSFFCQKPDTINPCQ